MVVPSADVTEPVVGSMLPVLTVGEFMVFLLAGCCFLWMLLLWEVTSQVSSAPAPQSTE